MTEAAKYPPPPPTTTSYLPLFQRRNENENDICVTKMARQNICLKMSSKMARQNIWQQKNKFKIPEAWD